MITAVPSDATFTSLIFSAHTRLWHWYFGISNEHSLMILTLKKCPPEWANWKQGCLPWLYGFTAQRHRNGVLL